MLGDQEEVQNKLVKVGRGLIYQHWSSGIVQDIIGSHRRILNRAAEIVHTRK